MSKFKIYDEDDNFIGEYIGDFVSDSKDTVSDSFDISFSSGCLAILFLLAFKFPWLIIVIVAWLIFKLIWIVLKFLIRILWWILRLVVLSVWWLIKLMVALIFGRNIPYWCFPDW